MTLAQSWMIASAAFLIDQASKWAILKIADLETVRVIEVIPGFVNFKMAWNRGINFGLLESESSLAQVLLISFAVAVCAGLSWWIRRGADFYRVLGVGLLIGGALANALDRIVHGAVVDFLNVTAFGLHNPFSFNIADTWVFLGAGLILFSPDKKHETPQNV